MWWRKAGPIVWAACFLGCGSTSRNGSSDHDPQVTEVGVNGATEGSGGAETGSGGAETSGSGALGGSTATAGPTAGGASGSAGSIGVDGAGGTLTSAGRRCTYQTDCELFQDCCTCRSVEVGSIHQSCDASCDRPLCDAQGIAPGEVVCMAGRCAIRRTCDENQVHCDAVPPSCAEGSVPAIWDSCYTGHCRDADQCTEVSSCAVCEAAGLACVASTISFQAHTAYRCIAPSPECDPNDCECHEICGAPFECQEDDQRLHCVCPTTNPSCGSPNE